MTPFNKHTPFNDLPDLPPKAMVESVQILKSAIAANKYLAELKGSCQRLPYPELLLNTIVLQESKESSAIENIVTTQDELYRSTVMGDAIKDPASKEILRYREALYWGKSALQKNNLITTNLLVSVMQRLRNTGEEIRKNTGTKLANPITQDIIYTPPDGEVVIREKLTQLEKFINNSDASDLDPLIKMALIHYQFEAIHPFSDGNGRTGRILNVLYLIQQDLLGMPVLYLSKYIIDNKSDYYRLLREVTESNNWEAWIIYVLNGVAETSKMALDKINRIVQLREQAILDIKEQSNFSFSVELVDLMFSYPYIKVGILEEYKIAKRQTAAEYLKKITTLGWLNSIKIGRETYYVNYKLIKILST